jgi:hypothetical protein
MEEKIRHLLEGTTCSYSRREKSKIEPKIKIWKSQRKRNDRCTRVEIQGRGYLKFLTKSLGGVKAFRKNRLGGPPYKCFEISLGFL